MADRPWIFSCSAVTPVTTSEHRRSYSGNMQGRRLARRHFLGGGLALAGLGLLSGCSGLPIGPQRPARLPHVGYLGGSAGNPGARAFLAGLRDLGYVEGESIQ